MDKEMWLSRLISLACVAGAILLAATGKDGWLWFLGFGVLIHAHTS